ncbi:MAG TPA: GDSL-type esterase/lipase family protein [Acidimicrobiia bacterium]|nr:GDSL-type esterase/lipase family protein [Acidimicrobiia bacterium]
MRLLDNRLVRRVRPGIAATLDSVAPFRAAWEASNRMALAGSGPLWVALGDSTAQGIGADAPEGGYVGQLRERLDARSQVPWRVLNLSRSGARIRDVAVDQLARLDQLAAAPDLVTCGVGANDVTWRPTLRGILRDLALLLDRLPREAVIATVPRLGRRAPIVNDVIRGQASDRGLVIADVWTHTGGPPRARLASDHFHPSVRGYQDWADAFAEALGLDDPEPEFASHDV